MKNPISDTKFILGPNVKVKLNIVNLKMTSCILFEECMIYFLGNLIWEIDIISANKCLISVRFGLFFPAYEELSFEVNLYLHWGSPFIPVRAKGCILYR